MIKLSKLHICCILALGVMVVSHLGVVLVQSSGTVHSEIPSAQMQVAHESSAKAFGFIIPESKQISCGSVKELDSLFCKCGFDLAKAKAEGKAPRLYLTELPKDMRKRRATANATFIRALLPHILQVNEKILLDRTRLLALQSRQEAGGHLRRSEKLWLCKLAADYRCNSTKIRPLLAHVDIVPPSLALSQALIETGGGKSPAALKKNSTFGHMQTKTKVARFESLLANVEAYVKNLNRHSAYKEFRKLRASMRAKNQKLCSRTLAKGLEKYSIRKAAYIRDVQQMIRHHGLENYDHIKLEGQN